MTTPTLIQAPIPADGAVASDPDFMSPIMDPLSLQFILHARAMGREALDIGSGDSVAAAALVERGGYVLAVDPNADFLARLRERVPQERHSRLRTQVGALPHIEFERERFETIHAARVLHLLSDDDVERSLKKFADWMRPGGKLFLSVPSAAPGGRLPSAAGAGLLLQNADLLRDALERAGFAVENAFFFPLPWDASQRGCAVVSRKI